MKLMWLNAENLFLLSDQVLKPEHLKLDEIQWQKLSTSVFDNKPLNKTKQLAKLILEKNPDILMLCEVGGLESLKNFSSLFLGDSYSPALIEGNSDRNIDIGFLIKKNLPYYFDINSNRHRLLHFLYPHERENLDIPDVGKGGRQASHKFSRDVAELHLFTQDKEKPFLVLLATHLKSRLDHDGIDPSGFQRRRAELKTLLEIYREMESRFGSKVPIVVAGDMNGNASHTETDLEFQEIYSTTGLKDVGQLAGLAPEKRATYYQVGRNLKSEGRQLDYCFLSPAAQPCFTPTKLDFYRYRDEIGLELPPPTTLDAKLSLPSDHYPIYFELNLSTTPYHQNS
jgi:endonuclease/exonuclease/phosphatase family metal-dependent hydrolase